MSDTEGSSRVFDITEDVDPPTLYLETEEDVARLSDINWLYDDVWAVATNFIEIFDISVSSDTSIQVQDWDNDVNILRMLYFPYHEVFIIGFSFDSTYTCDCGNCCTVQIIDEENLEYVTMLDDTFTSYISSLDYDPLTGYLIAFDNDLNG